MWCNGIVMIRTRSGELEFCFTHYEEQNLKHLRKDKVSQIQDRATSTDTPEGGCA